MKFNFSNNADTFNELYRGKNFFLERQAIENLTFSWREINEILYNLDLQSGSTKLLMNGKVPEEDFVETYSEVGRARKKINKPAFYKFMREGATLVLNRVNKTSWIMQDICNQIARAVGGQTLANGYLAFKGTGSFGNHWDTHDVCVVQLYGRKRWLLYEPTFEYPLSQHTSAAYKSECPLDPVFDGYLEAGDILYIPRGWWHNALPDSGPTFHVAVGIYNPKITDYLHWLSVRRLPDIKAFRRSIFNENDEGLLGEALKSLSSEFSKKENFRDFLGELVSSERWVSEFSIEKYGNPEFTSIDIDDKFEINSAYFNSVDSKIFNKINGRALNNINANEINELSMDDVSNLLYEDIISPAQNL